MMKEIIQNIIRKAIITSRKQGVFDYENLPPIILDAPKRKEFGDLATNVAMLLASEAGRPSRAIAEIIKKASRGQL